MAINIVSATTLLSSSILLLLFASCSSTSFESSFSGSHMSSWFRLPTSSGNVLDSGEGLSAGKSLSIGIYKFIMQKDCNLVLYEKHEAIWDSNTPGMGNNCSLVMYTNGELLIFSELNAIVWRTETGGEYGYYSLVLHPNGNAVIYSQPIWSTGHKHKASAPPTKTISQNP